MAVAQHSIFLSRHGESEYMLDDLIGGDSPLTAAGHAYAEQLPRIMLPLLQQVGVAVRAGTTHQGCQMLLCTHQPDASY
jgi:6-phosphofructo-2-kinase/fructose-2,6-biphosphatase 2